MAGGGWRTRRPRALWAVAAAALFTQFALGAAPAAAADPLKADTITAGAGHTCAIRASGQAVCWGSNFAGQGGDGTTNLANKSPVPVKGLTDAVEISAGYFHTCAIRSSGEALCWGKNDKGQLGDDSVENKLVPTPVKGLADAVEISAGFNHTCAIRSNEEALCWGLNEDGQLGDGTETNRDEPVAVTGLTDAVQIGAGGSSLNESSCAIRANEEAVCWGDNELGQIGDTTNTDRLEPTPVEGLTDAAQISVGSSHACAIRANEEAVCWGGNAGGQLGDGNMGFSSAEPTAVIGLTDAAQISAGGTHTCAVRSNNETLCWGDNTFGQLGIGTNEAHDEPEPVVALTEVAQIATSAVGIHTCAIRSNEEALCWGMNSTGQLGDGTIENRNAPTTVLEAEPPPTPVTPIVPLIPADTVVPLVGPPAPIAGVQANASLVSGTVRIRRPGAPGYVPLSGTESIPIGSLIDTRNGKVRIVSAADAAGGTRSADFYGGLFRLLQGKKPGAVTEVRLTGPLLGCGGAKGSGALAKKGSSGRLVWGSGKGSHRSTGHYSSATVRGTRWLVWDRCDDTTLTRVAEGTVAVLDFTKDRTVIVRKGKQYVAQGN